MTTTKKPKPLSWKARRQGTIYCAPACGRGCTKKEHDLAQERGRKLAKRLSTKKVGLGKWTVLVHENLGWHYRAVSPCGRIKVHENRYQGKVDSYTAFINEVGRTGGRWAESGDTPAEAMKNVIQTAVAARDSIAALVDGLTEGLTNA